MSNGSRFLPTDFIEFIRRNINSFVNDSYCKFQPYYLPSYGIDDSNRWNSTDFLHSVLNIDIAGPDNGSVIVSEVNSGAGWTFTTIDEPRYGEHPVSGNREFGVVINPDGSFTIYTKGADRLTSIDGSVLESASGIPFASADGLWASFQQKINSHSGISTIGQPITERPNWSKIRDVANGVLPLSTLSRDCVD